MTIKRALGLGLVAVLLAAPAQAQGMALNCGSLENAYGPFDYTNPTHFKERLPIVESAHFDRGVQSLRGHARYPQNLPGDIDYTLRAFPNHHLALDTMSRYYLSKERYNRAPLRYSAECYFQRAMALQPADGVVRLLYGLHLYKTGNTAAAEQRFKEALDRSPDDPEVHYNLGLVMAKSKRYEEARTHAKKAYALGHPMPGLRNKLKRAGHWD